MIERIKILTEFGKEELEKRLKRVKLKGFPEVEIYKQSNIEVTSMAPKNIKERLFVPQPTVYRKGFLDRIDTLAELFSSKGINIFCLNGGVDYFAYSDGEKQRWTLIPPVIENLPFNFTNGRLNYAPYLSRELSDLIEKSGHGLNPDLIKLSFPEYPFSGLRLFPLICDGSHRIHNGIEREISQNVIFISKIREGFPYYAAPKPYSVVHVKEKRPDKGADDKTHILKSPAHKSLYRLFPTGGILNGTIRPE